MAGQINGIKPRTPSLAVRRCPTLAEIHQHPSVGRPGRRFDQKILGQKPFAAAVDTHDADIKPAAKYFGKGDQISARRPHRRRITALALADPANAASVRVHNV